MAAGGAVAPAGADMVPGTAAEVLAASLSRVKEAVAKESEGTMAVPA